MTLEEVFFLDTPITNVTEEAIHKKTPTNVYIAQTIYNCYPKKRSGIPWHLFDFTASFPCCAGLFLFSRCSAEPESDDLVYHLELNLSCHRDFGNENNVLEVEKNRVNLKFNLDELLEGKTSRNPFRWMLYYKRYGFILLFLCFIIRYMKKRNAKDELRFLPFKVLFLN